MKKLLVILLFVYSFVFGLAQPYKCVTGGNIWKTENGGVYTAPEGYIITSVFVKAGQNCYQLPHECYEIISGGVGYNYVEVVNAGGCQDLSHLEGNYKVQITPTVVYTSTITFTDTPITPSDTPDFTQTPMPTIPPLVTPTHTMITPTPFSGTPTPWSPVCTNPGGCTGSG
jgi:hypothetical protein